jgi:hypothetical protein
MKSRFSPRAQIAINWNDCVWRKFSIDPLVVRNAMVLPGLSVRVHDFETIIGRQAETRRSPCRLKMCRIFVLNGKFRGAAATP